MGVRILGPLLRRVRVGESALVWNTSAAYGPASLTVSSPAFGDGDPIPRQFAAKGIGENISPPLRWCGVPPDAREILLVVEDADVPMPSPLVHAIAVGIDPGTTELPQGALGKSAVENDAVVMAKGSFGQRGYGGPRPIPGHGPHRYVFQIFAVDTATGLDSSSGRKDVVAALDGHVVARGILRGTFERP